MTTQTKNTLIQILFVDLKNQPFKNLYHEVRKSGEAYALSAGNSNAQGLGVWIEQPAGTHLDIIVKHPISKKMIPAHQYIVVPDKKGKIRIQAPFYIEEKVKLQKHEGSQGDYRRKTHKVKKGETLTSIAKHYGTDWQVLFQLNKDKLDDPDEIQEGQTIKVPPKNSALRKGSSTNSSGSPQANHQSSTHTNPKSQAHDVPHSSTSKPTTSPSNENQTKPHSSPVTQSSSSSRIISKAGELWDDTVAGAKSVGGWVDEHTKPAQEAIKSGIDKAKEVISTSPSSDTNHSTTPSNAVQQHKPSPVQTTNTQTHGETSTPRVDSTTTGDCVCQTYNLIWGAKVSCDFRRKVVEISKDLWPKNYLDMANKLMAVFAWESGGTFKADAPNRTNSGGTGLIQIMPKTYTSLTGNKYILETVDNYWKNGKTLKRVKQLADMTEVQQLDLVKKYFEPLRGKNPEFIDFYLQVLFPASAKIKADHVVFAKSPELLDRPQESESLKKDRVSGFKQNNIDPNHDHKVMKSEIQQSIQHYLDDGATPRYRNFKQTCSVVVKPTVKIESNGKWHDPVINPICTLYMQSGNGGVGTAGEHWGLFGTTRNGHPHQGLDLFATVGTEAYACIDAEVFATNHHNGYGQTLTLKVKNKTDLANHKRSYNLIYSKEGEILKNSLFNENQDIFLFYAHLSKILVKKGDTVTAGQRIALTGTSGVKGGTCAPHLHFEIFSTIYAVGMGLKYRCHPGQYVFFKNVNQMTEAEKALQKNTAKQRH